MLEEVEGGGGAVEGTMLKREGAVGEGVQMLKREQVCVCVWGGGGGERGWGWGVGCTSSEQERNESGCRIEDV